MPGGGKGGSSSSTVTVNNGPVDVDSTVEVRGLDNVNITARLEPTPLRTESRQELVLPQPLATASQIDAKADLKTDSKNALSVDLKPVVLDVCTTNSTKLPHGQISQPFNLHFGLTWFGLEVLGFNFGGESRTIMQDLPKRPAVDTGVQDNAAPAASAAAADRQQHTGARVGGLRVRIK